MAVHRDELRLLWPADLFAAEARDLLRARPFVVEDDVRGLLEEAFAEGRAPMLFTETGPLLARYTPEWGSQMSDWEEMLPEPEDQGLGPGPGWRLLSSLAQEAEAGAIPRYERPRYWSARRRRLQVKPTALHPYDFASYYADIVTELDALGYFDDAFGSGCPDARDDHNGNAQQLLIRLLDFDPPVELWPLRQDGRLVLAESAVHDDVLPDVVLDVVEALHDLVARPRRRAWHQFHDGWDYSDFSRPTGRAVYRWRVNEMLARTDLGLRLADSGADAGRLVHVAGDDRDQLVVNVLSTPEPAARATVEHAVQQFRSRAATREDKRLAVVALAGLYEEREQLLRTAGLLKEDERALGHIANKFNLRHRNGQQQSDYSEDFLEWIYWWYLATVELTDRLLARTPSTPASPAPTDVS